MNKCPDIDDVQVPWMIENLLNDGYVVWFANGRSLRDKSIQKTGQQFWLEDGELITHNVDPYHRKETKKGHRAWREFDYQLEAYSKGCFSFSIIGDDCMHSYYGSDIGKKTLRDAINRAIKYTDMPTPPEYISDFDLIENITPDKIITFHKRKQVNTNALHAGDAKAIVFKWLHKRYPNAVIVPEFGIGGQWGKNSIVDLAVFDKKKMIFVEIKAETDSFARLKSQLEASSKTADEVWLALYENKHVPNDIPLHVGIITFDKNGKIKLLKKPQALKQDKRWIGHIWTTELHDYFAAYQGSSAWLKSQRDGVEGLTKVAQEILGKNARQFTINAWRRRHHEEFIWRRDLLIKGDVSVMSIPRGKNENISSSYFYQNYNFQEHGLHEPGLKALATKEWVFSKKKKSL